MSYVTAGREIQSEAEVYKKSDMLHFGLQNLQRGLQSCKKQVAVLSVTLPLQK